MMDSLVFLPDIVGLGSGDIAIIYIGQLMDSEFLEVATQFSQVNISYCKPFKYLHK